MTTPSTETVAAWRQKHPEYKTHRAAYQRQWRRKVKMQQLSMLSDVLPVEIPEEKQMTPAAANQMLRRIRVEEGLDRPQTPHVCSYYPPAFRCVCGKQGQAPAVRRYITFQPYRRKEQ